MIPPDGDGMYQTFLDDARKVNPDLRVIGLTATPFRLKSGMICGPDNILNHICYEVGVKELIRDGYLCPLISKAGSQDLDTTSLHLRYGEFVSGEVEAMMDSEALVESACNEIVNYTKDRKSILVFASGVDHGKHLAEVLSKKSETQVFTVFGETATNERDKILTEFKNGKIKYLVNMGVLTTGFDAPNIDCVAMVRPTMSPGLFYQMVGRGFRLHPDKQNCLILDFGGNILRHGPVDAIRVKDANPRTGNGEAPAKKCPKCNSVVHISYSICPDCGFEFPPPEKQKHDAKASTEGVLSGQTQITEYEVRDVYYSIHYKNDAPEDAPTTMRVDYEIGLTERYSEWVCFEHTGYARNKAEAWWRQRSNADIPTDTKDAVFRAKNGSICKTKAITVCITSGDKFPRIVGYELGEKPEADPFFDYKSSKVDDDFEDMPF
jgi:DNA repair protein RadD